MNNLINDTTFATKNNLVGFVRQFVASYILAGIGNYCLASYSLFQQLKKDQAQTISHFPVPLLKTVSDLGMKEDVPKLMLIPSAPPASLLQEQEDTDLERAIQASLKDAQPAPTFSALEDVAVRMSIEASLEDAQPAPSSSLLQGQEDTDLERAIQASLKDAQPAPTFSALEDVAVRMSIEASLEDAQPAPSSSLLQGQEDTDLERAIQASLKDLKEVWIDDFNAYFNYELQKYGKQNVEDLEKMQEVMANLPQAELEENLLHYQEVINYYDNPEAIENIDEVEAKYLMHAIYAKAIIERELHMKE